MSKNPLTNLKEERIQSTIDRLGRLRELLEYGQLDDDIRMAIECMEYLSKRTESIEEVKAIGYWIIKTYGTTRSYTCSVCGHKHWTMFEFNLSKCDYCNSVMDRTNTVFEN